MSTSTITLDGNPVTLVPLPTCAVPSMVEPWVNDSVASITFPFTGQTQTQASSGADIWGMMVTYPPLTELQAAPMRAFLKQMRGISRAFQWTPADYVGPAGLPSGVPVTSGALVAAATTLVTTGWTPSTFGLLLQDDLIQIGYRLHAVLDIVSSDGSGNASFEIWPSLREDVASGTTVITGNPLGLFRLAGNKRNWSKDYNQLTHISFPITEYR